MNNSRSNMLGIYSFFGFRLSLIEKLTLIKDAGFDATTLWWGDEFAFSEVQKKSLPQLVRDKGLYLENIHVPYQHINNLFHHHKSVRKDTLYHYLQWIEDCAQYNIPVMVMHVTDGSNLPDPGSNLYNSFEKLIHLADNLGIIVAIENTERNDYIDFLLTEFDSNNLGFCYDSSHANLHCGSIDLLKKWKHRISALHLSDNDQKADRHWLPGKGSIDWNQICSHLVSYKGCITLETFADVDLTANCFLMNAYNKARWIKSKL